MARVLPLLIFGILFAVPAAATTVRFPAWWELVSTADFIGTIECTTAGGIVAEHKVLDCWLGDEQPSASIRVQLGVNYWGSAFPACLVGQQYFVVAYKNDAPSTIGSTSAGGAVPVWWRDLQYDYYKPLGIPFWNLPEDDEPFELGDRFHKDMGEARRYIREYRSLSPAGQEATMLAEYIVQEVEGRRFGPRGWGNHEFSDKQVELTKKFATGLLGERDPLKLLDQVLAHLEQGRGALGAARFKSLLMDVGGAEALHWLGRRAASELPFGEEARGRLMKQLVLRCRPGRFDEMYPKEAAERQANSEKWEAERAASRLERETLVADLDQLLKIFRHEDHEYWWLAFEELSKRDPERVVKWLMAYGSLEPEYPHDQRERAHALGSWFGSICGVERVANLTLLLKAKCRGIRVAAAVYMCFDDLKAGSAALKTMLAEDDLDAYWAALTLARRGDRQVLPRLFELRSLEFKDDEDRKLRSAPVLHGRVEVLFSNSAAAAGQAPPLEGETWQLWWEEHPDVELVDPWLSELSANRMD